MNKIVPYEDQECYAFVEYLRHKKLKHTHVANEGKLPVQYRIKLRKMGLSPGVPDYIIIHPKGLVFIEMKRINATKSSVRHTQKRWIEELNKLPGVGAFVAYGADEAINIIENL